MKQPSPGAHAPSRRRHLAAGLAGIATSVALIASVVLVFGSAAPPVWLAPSPELLEMAANCDRHVQRRVRESCREQLLAARQARDRREAQVAAR